MVAITRPASSCSSPTCVSIRTIRKGRVSKFPPPMWPTAFIRPGLFKLTAADPAPERVVPWIVGVTSQAVVANRSAQSSPGTVRRRYRAVTNVTFLRCTSSYTKVFTLWPRAPLKEDAMREPKPKEQRNSTYKRAGATLYKRGAPAQWSLP